MTHHEVAVFLRTLALALTLTLALALALTLALALALALALTLTRYLVSDDGGLLDPNPKRRATLDDVLRCCPWDGASLED